MTSTHHVAQGVTVYDSTVTTLVSTDDRDSQGYRATSGGNRSICHGIDPDGYHVIYMSTSGDDVILDVDDLDAQTCWLSDMADESSESTPQDRVTQGHARLTQALAGLRERYEGNEAALDLLDNCIPYDLESCLGSDAMALMIEGANQTL